MSAQCSGNILNSKVKWIRVTCSMNESPFPIDCCLVVDYHPWQKLFWWLEKFLLISVAYEHMVQTFFSEAHNDWKREDAGKTHVHPLSDWPAGTVEKAITPSAWPCQSFLQSVRPVQKRAGPLLLPHQADGAWNQAVQVSHQGTSTVSMDLCPRLSVNRYFGQVSEKLMAVVETRALSEVLCFSCVMPVGHLHIGVQLLDPLGWC